MPKIKWSQFNNAGNIQAGDIVVGLRAGTNVQFSPVTSEQVQSSFFNYSLATGANDAFVATLGPTVTSYTDGLLVTLNTQAFTNLTGTPTLQVNALTAKTITFNGLQLEPYDLEANATYVLIYDASNDYFNLVNPSISSGNTRLIQFNEYNAAIDSGVVNAYVANITPPIDSLTGFLTILCKITNANTGASTLTVNGQTAGIVTANNAALVGGELIANQVALFLYDPTWGKFILVNPSNNVTTLLPVINHRLARFDGTSGRIQNSSATLADTGVLTLTADAVINTVNIGLGAGSVATNTRVGVSALGSNTTGARNVAMGYQALQSSNAANSSDNVVIGNQAARSATTIYSMTLLGSGAGLSYTTSNNSVAVGVNSLRTATTGGDRSVAIGVNALYTTNGAVNTAVGYRAGEAFTGNNGLFIGGNAGVLTTGGDNTIIGTDAATALTTGANNTLIGRQAGSGQTTGSSCTSIGFRAAQSSTTVSSITAIGADALRLNTVADNTAIGAFAMDACTSGTGVAVGKDALGALTTGANNVALGLSSLSAITTASDNTAIGYQAGLSITGSQNVAVGSGALTNGINSGSVAIGYQASSSLTTGAMTAIGYQAGKASTTGYNMVLVGSGAGVAMTTGNNVVAVGNNAFGTATTGSSAVAVGVSALGSSNAAAGGVAVGNSAGSLYTVNFACFVGTSAGQNITTGGGNTIMGSPAGQLLTTGANNTIFGYQALNSATTSSGSTALGYRALANNTAANNTAVGSNALENCTSGTGTAVGKSALAALTTGTQNTAVGTSALSAITINDNCAAFGYQSLISVTGGNNTAFGILTGNSGATGAVTLTTGTFNTMLGYRACPNAADAAGTISIGADAVAAKATGATSGDDGPGIAIGSASYPVGFRGDGMIYPSAGAISGYMQVKINGTAYKLALYALS